MSDILERIVASKRQEIERRRTEAPARVLDGQLAQAPPVRNFRTALYPSLSASEGPFAGAQARRAGLAIIAEVKKASPTGGVLRADFEPVTIARIYEANGANAISVLTDEPFFQGRLSYLAAIRAAVMLPVLCKDFILDRYQLLEARVYGADAVLLIAEILNDGELRSLLNETRALGMQALVEIYERENLRRVLDAGATIVGVNNRNLRTFVTSLEHTLELLPDVPADRCLVSESGIRAREDMLRLERAGVHAVLIGETFMRAPDIGAKLRELRGV